MSSFLLHDKPQHHPDCCVALSRPFITLLGDLLPRYPQTVLSIGSGAGLLEYLLQQSDPTINLRTVEVNHTANKYLDPSRVTVVNGTWATDPTASEAAVWLFVYPREPKLVRCYIEQHASEILSRIIWIGPRYDWEDYVGVFTSTQKWSVRIVDTEVVAHYEMVTVIERQ